MKQIVFKGIYIWAHISCICWSNFLDFKDKERKDIKVVRDLEDNNDACSICSINTGMLGKCYYPDCDVQFHYSCARKLGIIRPLSKMRNTEEIRDKTNIIPLYCIEHLKIKAQESGIFKE